MGQPPTRHKERFAGVRLLESELQGDHMSDEDAESPREGLLGGCG